MTASVNEKGALEEVPALGEDAVAAWRRFEGGEAVEEEGSKVDDRGGEDGEEGGVRLDEKRGAAERGDAEMMHGYCGQPEPVAADEFDSDVE